MANRERTNRHGTGARIDVRSAAALGAGLLQTPAPQHHRPTHYGAAISLLLALPEARASSRFTVLVDRDRSASTASTLIGLSSGLRRCVPALLIGSRAGLFACARSACHPRAPTGRCLAPMAARRRSAGAPATKTSNISCPAAEHLHSRPLAVGSACLRQRNSLTLRDDSCCLPDMTVAVDGRSLASVSAPCAVRRGPLDCLPRSPRLERHGQLPRRVTRARRRSCMHRAADDDRASTRSDGAAAARARPARAVQRAVDGDPTASGARSRAVPRWANRVCNELRDARRARRRADGAGWLPCAARAIAYGHVRGRSSRRAAGRLPGRASCSGSTVADRRIRDRSPTRFSGQPSSRSRP